MLGDVVGDMELGLTWLDDVSNSMLACVACETNKRHMSVRVEALVSTSRCVDCQMVTRLPLFGRSEDKNHDGSNDILIGELFLVVALLEIRFDKRCM